MVEVMSVHPLPGDAPPLPPVLVPVPLPTPTPPLPPFVVVLPGEGVEVAGEVEVLPGPVAVLGGVLVAGVVEEGVVGVLLAGGVVAVVGVVFGLVVVGIEAVCRLWQSGPACRAKAELACLRLLVSVGLTVVRLATELSNL
jgi:hypothetical protein